MQTRLAGSLAGIILKEDVSMPMLAASESKSPKYTM